MLKKIVLAACIAACLCSQAAQAAFIHTDWKTTGDKQATLDTDTGIEWLKLNNTNYKSMNDVKASLGTTYAGWRLPTAAEVTQMFWRLLGAPYGSESGALNTRVVSGISGTRKATALELLGQTSPSYAYGWFEPAVGASTNFAGGGVWGSDFYSYWTYSSSPARSSTGVFLVSDGGTTLSSLQDPSLNANNPNAPVNNMPPEPTDVPAPLGFVALLMIGVGLMARKRHA